MRRVAVVFPGLDTSRDLPAHPYFADLDAIETASSLRRPELQVTLVDAFALPGATLEHTSGGSVRLGAPIEEIVSATAPAEAVVVVCDPDLREREPRLADVLRELRATRPAIPIALAVPPRSERALEALLGTYSELDAALATSTPELAGAVSDLLTHGRPRVPFARPADEGLVSEIPLPAWDLVDVASYFRFLEKVIERSGRAAWLAPAARSLPARFVPFVGSASSDSATSSARLDRLLAHLVASGAQRVHALDDVDQVDDTYLAMLLGAIARHPLGLELANGIRIDRITPAHVDAMRGKVTTLLLQGAEPGRVDDRLDALARRAADAGIQLLVDVPIGGTGQRRREINDVLEAALAVQERTGALPRVRIVGTGGDAAPGADPPGREALEKFQWTFDRRVEAGQGPNKIIMNATYRCNNRCTFCATGTRTQFDGDFDRQREILLKYRKLGVRLLDIDGGEPTLNPMLFALVRFARKIGYEKVNVTTNGRMSSYEAFASDLAHCGVTSLLFSIHGPDAQIHAQNVGVAEAFEQTLAGVRNVVRLAPPGLELGANVTLTKSNFRHLPRMAELVWELGLRWYNIQFLTPFGRATRSVCPDTQEAANIVMRVIDAFRDRMKLQVINLPFCFMPGYEEYLLGDLLKLERHMVFVNNDEVNLAEYLRERRTKKEICGGCPHSVFCGGFYELDDVPEPTWLVRPEDLVRPIAAEVPRAGLAPRRS